MGFKYKEELLQGLLNYAEYFKHIVPESFPVHGDYLIDGLTEADFCRCYGVYQQKMLDLQLAMMETPEAFGLLQPDKKVGLKPTHNMPNAYVWLFLALGKSGEVKNGVFAINGATLKSFCDGAKLGKNEAKPKNVDKLILKLNDFGFNIDGGVNGDFKITSEIPGLCATIKASVLTQYAGDSMTSDYPGFNYRMYKFGAKEFLPFEETMTYSLMSEQKQEFSRKLISEMYDLGWTRYIFFPSSIHGGRLTFPTVEYYYNSNRDSFILIRITRNFDIKTYMNSLPERYYNFWKTAKTCRGCRTGPCAGRAVDEELFGKKTVICKGNVKVVYACEIDDIPYILDAACATAGKKRKNLK